MHGFTNKIQTGEKYVIYAYGRRNEFKLIKIS